MTTAIIEKMEIAENWYNSTSKQDMIAWANENGVDIGQNAEQLHEDWNEKIMQAYADKL